MGLLCSILATLNLCFNRCVKYCSCICVLGGMSLCMMIMVAYGITMGYHVAQEELARFAVKSRGVNLYFKPAYPGRRSGDEYQSVYSLYRRDSSLLNLTSLNKSTTVSVLEFYDKSPPNGTLDFDPKETPVFIEFTSTISHVSRTVETTPSEELPEPSEKLLERDRRSKDNIPKNLNQSFWRPLKKALNDLQGVK